MQISVIKIMNKYCVVCGKEFGPDVDKHCTDTSIVAILKTGVFKKVVEYYSLRGDEINANELSQMKERETTKAAIWKTQQEEGKKKPEKDMSQEEPEWYYFEKDQKIGPVDKEKIYQLLSSNILNNKSLVWQEGMAGKLPLKDTLLNQNRVTIPELYLKYDITPEIKSRDSMIIIPRSTPYKRPILELSELLAKKDYDSISEVRVEFPKKCVWCGSDEIVGNRKVELTCKNPSYIDQKNRNMMKGAAVIGGIAAGALGANVLGQGLVYGTLKPGEGSENENLREIINVPYCALHENTDCAGILELINSNGKEIIIKVRNEEFAKEEEQYINDIVSEKFQSEHITDNLKRGEILFSTLIGIKWPNICVVCGAANPSEITGYGIESIKVNIPVCATHLQKVNNRKDFIKRVEIINNFYKITFCNKQIATEVWKLNTDKIVG
jgi:hypothetical protein